MTVPTYDQFIEPILRFLADQPNGAAARDAMQRPPTRSPSPTQTKVFCCPAGISKFTNRAGWAHDRLKRAGLSSSPRRGFWQLTDAGRDYVGAHAMPLQPHEVTRLARAQPKVMLDPTGNDSMGDAALYLQSLVAYPTGTDAQASPDDRLELAVAELRSAVAAELSERLAAVSPSFFEVIVLELLHSMGYGANRADL